MTQEKMSLFFENLHRSTSIDAFRNIYAEDVVFKDPFNEVKGVEAVHGVFAHMYENLDNPRFVITEYIGTQATAYVKWDFIFAFKGEKKEQCFEGVSRLCINDEDKVMAHTDYWDAAEHIYEKMPIVGSLLRFIKRKISRS
ncbi:nuclear transport factor 2 family protein [Sulfurovum sp.]|jgi:hypothetical protein|uniref:nuclear transport factor 2 family protein n=1 Tax=Sulfurovum sp. TaxID=1969726 RepID=UPI0025E91911|nr:nuclear transport factor 2 family protein [Sulfurovum sp.]